MSKHTPGPWVYDEASGEIHADNNGALTTIASMTDWFTEYYQERYANARLISAAPDLLDALEAIKASSVLDNKYFSVDHLIQKVDAAIAKAKGTP